MENIYLPRYFGTAVLSGTGLFGTVWDVEGVASHSISCTRNSCIWLLAGEASVTEGLHTLTSEAAEVEATTNSGSLTIAGRVPIA